VAYVWVGDGTNKSASWKTILIFLEGRGDVSCSWSQSALCDSGTNSIYSMTYKYYCVYHALTLNNSLSPTIRFILEIWAAICGALNSALPMMPIMEHRVRQPKDETAAYSLIHLPAT
jgi:hypothetical protein